MPLVHSALDVRARRHGLVTDGGGNVLVDDTTPVRLSADAFGIGDLLLRSKYRLADGSLVRVALGLTLRVPTGAERDFHGLGDWTVTPLLVAGRELSRTHLHGSLGFQLNADDAERHRLRYAVGASARVWRQFGVFADLLGNSAVTDDDFVLTSLFPAVLPPERGIRIASSRTTNAGTTVSASAPRNDLVDAALGFKVDAFGRAVAFAGAVVPLTADGLRADVLPTAGIQVSF